MALESPRQSGRLIAVEIAIAAALTAALLAVPANTAQADEGASSLTVAPLTAQSDESDYFIALGGVPYDGDYGIYGKPGEKLVISKLPKAGTYKFTATGYDESGKKLCKATYRIVVKKKPSLKIQMSINGDKNRTKSNYSWAYANESIMLTLAGAKFGWDNNTRKPFYTWTVKDLDTGKTATWNSKEEVFKKNAIIGGGAAFGCSTPFFMGSFLKAGTFKITAKVYHSNKKIAAISKKVTIR